MRFIVYFSALLALSLAVCEARESSAHQAETISRQHSWKTSFTTRQLQTRGAEGPDFEPEADGPDTVNAFDSQILIDIDDMDDIGLPEECTSVVDIAVDAELTTLIAAVTAAGLAETLGSDFEGTVFAPTEEAFANLLEALEVTADELLVNTDLLTQVLLIHVVPGVQAMAADLEDGQEIPTAAEGVSLTVSIRDGDVFIVAPSGVEAQVITPDVIATCGAVVHVIDAVLTP